MTGVLNARSKNRTQGNPSPAWSRLSRHRRPIYTAGLKGLMIEPWINQKAHQSWSPGIGPSPGRLSRGASLASPLPYFISADRSPRTSNSHVEFWEEEDCLLENSPRTEKNKASSPHSTRSVPQLHEHQVESPNVAYDTHMNPNHCEITDLSWCPQLTQVSTKIRQQTLITSMNREQSRSRRSVSGACEGGDQIIYNFELAERRERLCLEISYAAHERGWNAGNLAKQYLNDLMKLHPSPSQSYRFVSHVIPRLSELRAIHMYALHMMYSKEDVLQIPEIAVWDHEADETLFDTLASEKKRRSYFIEEEKAQRGNLLGFIMGIYRSILNAQSSVIDDLSDYDLQHLEAFKSAFGVNCELGIIDVVQKSHQNTEALVLPHTESILRKKPSMVKTFSKMIKKIGQPPLAKTNRPSLPRTTIHEDIELVLSESEASIASQNENPSSPIGRLMRRLSSTRGRNSHRYIQSDDESKMESSNISQQAPKSHEKEKKKKRKETEKQSNQFNEKEKAKSVVLKLNRSEDRPLTSGISFVAHRAGSVIKSSIKDTLRLDQSSESVVQKAPDENIINPKTTEQVEEHKHQENNTVLQERIGILKERALTTATLPLNHHDTLVSETQHTNAKKQRASLQRDGEDVHDNQHRASHAKQAKSNTASALQQHSIKRESSGQKIIQGKHHHVDTTSGNQNKLECNEVAAYDEETKSVLIDDIVHDVEKLTSKSLKGSTELSRRKHKVSQNDVLQTAEPTQDTFDDAGTYFTARTECSLLEE